MIKKLWHLVRPYFGSINGEMITKKVDVGIASDTAWQEKVGKSWVVFVKRGPNTVQEKVPTHRIEDVRYLSEVSSRLRKELDDIGRGLVTAAPNRTERRRLAKQKRVMI